MTKSYKVILLRNQNSTNQTFWVLFCSYNKNINNKTTDNINNEKDKKNKDNCMNDNNNNTHYSIYNSNEKKIFDTD